MDCVPAGGNAVCAQPGFAVFIAPVRWDDEEKDVDDGFVMNLSSVTLDHDLCARLAFTGNPEENSTVVVVPGLGVREGQQEKKVDRALRKALGWGAHLNIVTFLYPSHRQKELKGFDGDPEALARVMRALRSFGVPKDRIGFLAICYGVNVLCRYRELFDTGRFAVLIEPLLGYRGLRLPIRVMARLVFAYLDRIGKVWAWGRKEWVNPRSFDRFMSSSVSLSSLAMPFMTISNRRHELIFKQKHLLSQLEGTDARLEVIDAKQFSRRSVAEYYRVVTDALQDWVLRHRPPRDGDFSPPPEPQSA
jgi:hypothetical protein